MAIAENSFGNIHAPTTPERKDLAQEEYYRKDFLDALVSARLLGNVKTAVDYHPEAKEDVLNKKDEPAGNIFFKKRLLLKNLLSIALTGLVLLIL